MNTNTNIRIAPETKNATKHSSIWDKIKSFFRNFWNRLRDFFAPKCKDTAMEKEAEETTTSVALANTRALRVRLVRRGLNVSLFLVLAMLALRHVMPTLEEDIPYMYGVLDEIVLPIIEWAYKLGLKGFHELMAQPWFRAVIEFFAGLAA